MSGAVPSVLVLPVPVPDEVVAGDDLASLVAARCTLDDGDILVVTSKVVSKSEGRVVVGARDEALAGETDRVVATRGATSIVRTRHGLVLAAAGIDASNTPTDTVVVLPLDPDASARGLRERLHRRDGVNVAVLVSDTAGRAWRTGQTDITIGAAGMEVLHDYAGSTDDHGNLLSVTAPAVADEVTGAADLVKGKLARVPVAVVRGLGSLVLPPGEHGPGARALVRPESDDLFGYGAREAVMAAARGSRDPDNASAHRGFPAPAAPGDLALALRDTVPAAVVEHIGTAVRVTLSEPTGQHGPWSPGGDAARVGMVALAFGWVSDGSLPLSGNSVVLRFQRRSP